MSKPIGSFDEQIVKDRLRELAKKCFLRHASL